MSRAWQGGSTRAWRKIRAERLRIEPNCRVCGRPTSVVDHVIPLAKGGAKLDIANTQSLCPKHHRCKTVEDDSSIDPLDDGRRW